MKDTKVSIIVSTYSIKMYNDIIDLLEGIGKQTYNNVETIIIVDESKEFYNGVESFALNKCKNVKVIFNPKNKGLSYSRNIGISNSTSDIVVFIDDDAVPHRKWIEAIADAFSDINVGAVTGDVVPVWQRKDMSWFPRELHWMISCSYTMTPDHECDVERGFGTNMAFRRDLVDKIGMFDINMGMNGDRWLGGEDSDMFLRIKGIGKKVLFRPGVKVFHNIRINRITLRNIIKRAFRGGVSVAVMKRLRRKKSLRYDIKNSTEDRYLQMLLLDFYPNTFKELIKNPCIIPLKQMMVVFIVISSEMIGYLYGHLENIER